MTKFYKKTYRILSESSRTLVFFFECACTGEILGSLPDVGGLDDPVLEHDKLPALPRTSPGIAWVVLIAKIGLGFLFLRFFFFPLSISSILPKILLVGGGGIQSRSFFKCPLPHLHPHALYAKSYPFFVQRFWCLCLSDQDLALPQVLRYANTDCSHWSKHSLCMNLPDVHTSLLHVTRTVSLRSSRDITIWSVVEVRDCWARKHSPVGTQHRVYPTPRWSSTGEVSMPRRLWTWPKWRRGAMA